ncbi:hypothetical protein ACHQM5_010303 [Ranunculus cassubicifolius]
MAVFYDALEVLLMDILSVIKPIEGDVQTRYQVIDEIKYLVAQVESLRGVTVEPFGSFLSNLYTRWGDLDISIELPSSTFVSSVGKKRKQNLLRDLWRALRVKGVRNLQFISHARVPLLIFESHRGISCDISICNVLGLIKSKVFLWITEIDERFRFMVLLVKEWAKSQDINNPKSGTLNSYSLSLLVIFHFQTCEPPILPPLQELYAGNIGDLTGGKFSVERDIQDKCAKNIAMFRAKNVGRSNQSTVAELFFQFFKKFTVINRMAADYVVCTYTGKWELKSGKDGWMIKNYPLIIEDPFEQPDNAARAVGKNQLIMISEAFRGTNQRLSSNQIQDSLVTTLVRPHIRSQLNPKFQGASPGGFSGYIATTNHHQDMPPPSRNINQQRQQHLSSPNPVHYAHRPFMGTVFESRTVDHDRKHISNPSPSQGRNGPPLFMGTVFESKTVDPGRKRVSSTSSSQGYNPALPFVGTIFENKTVDPGPARKLVSSPSSSQGYNPALPFVGTIFENRTVNPGPVENFLPHQQFAHSRSGHSAQSQQVWRPRQSDR